MGITKIEMELIQRKKEFGTYYFVSMSILFAFYFLLSVFSESYRVLLKDCRTFYFFAALSSAFMWQFISRIEYNFIVLYRILLVFIFVTVLFLCLLHCHLSYTVYTYHIPITLLILMVTNKKIAVFFALLFVVLCFFIRDIALKFEISEPILITENNYIKLRIIELITLSISLFYTLFIYYYYVVFKKLETQFIQKKGSNKIFQNTSNILLLGSEKEKEKFEKLYSEIINHLETNKAYRNPDFSRKMLADSLDTNTSYISTAIKQNANQNFNNLINKYRIEEVVGEMEAQNYKIYTIEHIYTKAGFNQQSTFNRVFKEYMGKTPSEYIDKMEQKKAI